MVVDGGLGDLVDAVLLVEPTEAMKLASTVRVL
jgi:hypothetical protein